MDKLKSEIKLGASNIYIEKWIKQMKKTKNFLGIFSVNDLKCKTSTNIEERLEKGDAGTTLIFNNTPSYEKGEHWLLITKLSNKNIIFFDSFGAENFNISNYGQGIAVNPIQKKGLNFLTPVIVKRKKGASSYPENTNYLNNFLFNCLNGKNVFSFQEQMQSFDSNLCGFYCMLTYFIISKKNYFINIEELRQSIFKIGIRPKKELQNDKIVESYFKNKIHEFEDPSH